MTKTILHHLALAAAVAAIGGALAEPAFARGGRGGGARGGGIRSGGMSSMSRPSGGGFSRGGSGAYNRGGGRVSSRPSGGPSAGQLPSNSRPGGGLAGNRPGGEGPGAGRPGAGERPGGGDRFANIDRGDINIGNGADIDIDGGWGDWDDHVRHPIAAGIAVGAVAGMTAAAMGSWYYALPYGCSPYPYGGYAYYACGGYYLQPSYEGDTVVYVTVPDPKAGGTEAVAPPPENPS